MEEISRVTLDALAAFRERAAETDHPGITGRQALASQGELASSGGDRALKKMHGKCYGHDITLHFPGCGVYTVEKQLILHLVIHLCATKLSR